ncbi:MAG: hypothetical protein ACOYIH_08320 [Candidatus Fimadaptatus sp.]|jgi:hypothetical protein
MDIARRLDMALRGALADAGDQVRDVMERAPMHLERAAQEVLSGARSGRLAPDGTRASAPGEPPAQRTGEYMASWRALPLREQGMDGGMLLTASLRTGLPERALRLEHGGAGMAARPHMQRILDEALSALLSDMGG